MIGLDTKALRQALHWSLASGMGRNTALITVIHLLAKAAWEPEFDKTRLEIGQLLIEEGFSIEEIKSTAAAVADAEAHGTTVFDPDDPKNETQMRKMLSLMQSPGALFFLATITPTGITWSKPFVNQEQTTTIENEQIGGIASMVALAKKQSAQGNNCYVTTNSFKVPYYISKNSRQMGFRASENLAGSRTLTIDLDIKPDAYATRAEALTHLIEVLKQKGLPEPSLSVNSGRGIHAWWIFADSIGAGEWRTLADGFRNFLLRQGLKFDHPCTVNPAGVLRLPGTGNFKGGGKLAVSLSHIASPPFRDVEAIRRIVGPYAGQGRLYAGGKASQAQPHGDKPRRLADKLLAAEAVYDNFTAGVEDDYPTIDLNLAARECPMLADGFAHGGNGDLEPFWFLKIQLAHFSTDPIGNAVRLSYNNSRFTMTETEDKLTKVAETQAEKDYGWPGCAKFAAFSPHCKTCRHRDEGRSPLYFGLPVLQPANATEPAEPIEPVTAGADDWLAQSCRDYGVVPAGCYQGKLLPRDIETFSNTRISGVSFIVGIVEGDFEGYRCRIQLATEGSLDAVIRRDLNVLRTWSAKLGIGATANPIELIKALGRAGEDKSLIFDIGVNAWGGNETLFLKGVENGGDHHAG